MGKKMFTLEEEDVHLFTRKPAWIKGLQTPVIR